jgi:hypothetical protein
LKSATHSRFQFPAPYQPHFGEAVIKLVFDNKKVSTLQVSFKTDDLIGLHILTNPTLKTLDEVYNSRLLISTLTNIDTTPNVRKS